LADVPRLNVNAIAARRLYAQRLAGAPFASPIEVVRRLTAVQSQDYPGAKWAIGQRTRGVTESEIDRLFDEGAILRTHVLRPTWHFVLPEDIRWLLDLTGPRVRAGLAGRYRQLELDGDVFARAGDAFTAALAGGHHLTRPELGEVLLAAGISPEGQRLPHLLLGAELGGLIVSGPRRGKQFTYGLLDERVPKTSKLDHEEAAFELARRYFQSHGPAQLQDFVWWSGLTMADARKGVALAGPVLEHQAVDGKDYWSDPAAGPARSAAGVAHLLPNFDEYSVAYRDRTAMLREGSELDTTLFAFGSILANVVLVDGRVRGAWRRTTVRGGVLVEIRSLDRFGTRETKAVEASSGRLAQFIERPVELRWS
jgi:winged helix DNA-binding protein